MSVVATARPRASRFELVAAGDAVALAGLALLVGLLIALTWGTWGDIGADTGYDLVAGAHVAHGQLPYVDFNYYYGPLAPFLLGFAYFLGGGGLAPATGVGIVLACAIVLATYALGRRFAGVGGGFLAAALTAPIAFAPTNYSLVDPHSYSVSLALLVALSFVLALGRYADTDARRWLVAAGVAAGLVTLTRPEFTLAVFCAAAVWLVLRARAGGGRRETAVVATASLGIPALVYGAFLIAVPPRRLLFDNLYPVHLMHAGAGAVLKSYAPLTASSFGSLAGKLVLYALGVVVLLALARAIAARGRVRVAALVVSLAAGVAFVGVAAVRPETVRYYLRFAYGWIPAGAGLAVLLLLWRYRRSPARRSAAAQVELAGAVLLAVLAAKTYADFLIYAHIPQLAVYALPPSAVFLARVHLVEFARFRSAALLGAAWLVLLAGVGIELTLKDAHAQSAIVSGPGGAVRATPMQAQLYNRALAWIERTTPPSKPILVAPQLTLLYTLSGRADPLPELSLLPGALATQADERAAIRRLDQENVTTILISRRVYVDEHQTMFGGSFDRVLAAWIHAHFRRVATLRGDATVPAIEVWRR